MKRLITYSVALVALAAVVLAMSAFSSQRKPVPVSSSLRTSVGPTGHSGPTFKQLSHARAKVRWNRGRTAYWRHRAGLPQIKSSHAESHTTSIAYIHWINHRWVKYRVRAKWLAFHLPQTNDWQTAVNIVQRVWPGTKKWLLSCSTGEGGHSYWKWNGGAPFASSAHGSGAGSWMQYLNTTFISHFNAAYQLARSRRLPLPLRPARTLAPYSPSEVDRSRSQWTSPLAVAFAAGWARYIGNTSAWDPRIDGNCAW